MLIRPELIIPLSEEEERAMEETPGAEPVLEPGVWVRVIRAPHFGTLGRVEDLPAESRRMDAETFTRVVGIRTESGEYLELPRANVEIITQ